MKENILQSFLILLISWQTSVACIKLILALSTVKPDDILFHLIIYKQIDFSMHRFCTQTLHSKRNSNKLRGLTNTSKKIYFSSEKYTNYRPKNNVFYVHLLPAPTDPMSTNSSAQNDANNKPRKGPITVAVCRHPRVGKRTQIRSQTDIIILELLHMVRTALLEKHMHLKMVSFQQVSLWLNYKFYNII